MSTHVDTFLAQLEQRNPNQPEFLQAVHEVLESVMPLVLDTPRYRDAAILERLTEPDRTIRFRVTWEDDQHRLRVNRGWRVQFTNALGPYKGGLRFHPTVNESILKFLGFEQIFKNSLTGLMMGGGKGGSDFDPKGKSDAEVRRFCEAFMLELFRHVGEDTDVPAGDIGVGAREVGFMFGQYRRLRNAHTGVFTGKGTPWGGSHIRTEATGYGCVEFCRLMIESAGHSIEGKRCVVSGSGNVAQFAAQRLIALGAKVLAMSDSGGVIFDEQGITHERLEWIKDLKNNRRGRIAEYANHFKGVTYREHAEPWDIPCDLAFPCATQNEISKSEAETLVKNKTLAVVEGANMPTHPDAIKVLHAGGVLFAPGKASNAGGVGCSGLEMAQNAGRLQWPSATVESHLYKIMASIHDTCLQHAASAPQLPKARPNYLHGANVGGFIRVADAMLDQGVW
ncbi:MAG: NADP-specific glutamate dehydrogenase [Phycisphaeraceae bacterium]|nr:NADP-specific glutamate dehydrogenase [Phycisphaeraceae bacterium]MCW5762114.1 NADP-specific glutamate dehydrogenase [Phycisphaeraceae bacterium]